MLAASLQASPRTGTTDDLYSVMCWLIVLPAELPTALPTVLLYRRWPSSTAWTRLPSWWRSSQRCQRSTRPRCCHSESAGCCLCCLQGGEGGLKAGAYSAAQRSAEQHSHLSFPNTHHLPACPPLPAWLCHPVPRLRAKPVRTASGIAVVAVMSKPHRCPHIATTGNICVYCPGGPDSDFEYSTQSYTGYEPTSMRAIRARYSPYVQARARVDQLRRLGHSVDKVGGCGGMRGWG